MLRSEISDLKKIRKRMKALTELALQMGKNIGPVTANLGQNNCQIPFAPDYIRKMEQRGVIGKKRKSVKC